MFLLLLCLSGDVPSVLDHELRVAAAEVSMLEAEAAISEFRLAQTTTQATPEAGAVSIAAAVHSNHVAKLKAAQRYLERLQLHAKAKGNTKTSRQLVFAVPGFETHPQLRPVSRLIIQQSPGVWKESAKVDQSVRWANNEQLVSATVRSSSNQQLASSPNQLQQRLARSQSVLRELGRTVVWSTAAADEIHTASNTAQPRRLTADVVEEAQQFHFETWKRFRTHRSQFAKWTLLGKRNDEFEWPKLDFKRDQHRAVPPGQVRVWGHPTDAEIESAVATALLRVQSARTTTRRLQRGETAKGSELESRLFQVSLRRAEYDLVLAVREAYARPSVEASNKLLQQATRVYQRHASMKPLIRFGTANVNSQREKLETVAQRYRSGRTSLESWSTAQRNHRSAVQWLDHMVGHELASARQLETLSRLSR